MSIFSMSMLGPCNLGCTSESTLTPLEWLIVVGYLTVWGRVLRDPWNSNNGTEKRENRNHVSG
jgi:hypothetical protein